MCSPAYDVKCYVLTSKDEATTGTNDSGQISHPCNLVGRFPGINLISSSYRLATSLIDVISAIYFRCIGAYNFAYGSQTAKESSFEQIDAVDIKLKN